VENWDIAWGELLNQSLSIPVDVSARLDEIHQPVLLVSGDQDKLVPVTDTRRVAERLPNATLRILPNCGHVPQEECPEAFQQVVSDWLEATGNDVMQASDTGADDGPV
jgi:pimeloyl-ACP methyl ester carboxylesterase